MFANRPMPLSPRSLAALLFVLTAAIALLSACGDKDKSKIPVAQIEDKLITLDYFERKMNTMDPEFLPAKLDEREGRLELLETMINKEVMAIKAEELGFAADGAADRAADAFASLEAVKRMKEEIIKANLHVSHEELQEYYENLGRNLRISYMVFDRESDAIEARNLVEGGEDWVAVANRLSPGEAGPAQNWTSTMKYGTITDEVEKAVYGLPVGGISEPMDTPYGVFLIRVDGQVMERVPPMDSMREKLIMSVHDQKKSLAQAQFINDMFEEYEFVINDETLDTLFTALPEDLPMTPVPKEADMPSLNLHPSHLDMKLMSWKGQDWDLRRYYDFYTNSGWFARPRREHRVGGFRRQLKGIAVRELLPVAARDRGYLEMDDIRDGRAERREQVIVGALHRELIANDVMVTSADIDTFWANNSAFFAEPETRDGSILICANEEDARAARLMAENGVPWAELISRFGAPQVQPAESFEFGPVGAKNRKPEAQLLFTLNSPGAVSEARQLDSGHWLMTRLDKIHPPRELTLLEAGMRVRRELEKRTADVLFQKKVEEWKRGMLIRRYPENVDKAEILPEEDTVKTAANVQQ